MRVPWRYIGLGECSHCRAAGQRLWKPATKDPKVILFSPVCWDCRDRVVVPEYRYDD